ALTNKKVIDYGCGSGILSLAAIKLGAKHVHAVDIDPQALQATQNNALSNAITADELRISLPDNLDSPVDLIIANILLAPLMSLKERFHQLLAQNAYLVVSGLLSEQVTLLVNTYESAFTLVDTRQLDGWSLVVFAPK
ncbi:MAG: 50S ribosomal protein L11 methyltransferase, partial [bacterium]|nr:50S ribosomal protein L11 methyltransferase [bacterium]